MRAVRFLCLLVLAGVIGGLGAGLAHAETDAEIKALAARVVELYQAGKYAEAIPLAEKVAAATKARLGEDHLEYAAALNNLAQLLQAANRLAEAEPLMRRALAIDEKSLGPEHPDVAIDLNNLAQLLQATNRLVEAEPLMRRALAIDQKSYGPEHPNVAIRLNNLAGLLKATNRLAEAEPLIWRALAIDEKSYGPEHPNVAIRLNNLAGLLEATNRFAEAEPLYRRALAIDEKSFGPDHPKVALRLNNLAQLLQATNRLAEAEPLMRRALAIDEKSLGTQHPDVATDLNNLAQLLQDTNRLAEAEPLMRRALAIDEKSLGSEHSDVARDLSNLALLLEATNRLVEAEPFMRRALAIYEKSLGPEHPDVAIRLNNLALLRAESGDWTGAAALHRRATPIMTVGLGSHGESDPREIGKVALAQNTWALRGAARAGYRASPNDASALAEGFDLAQWAVQTSAADALAQMSVRFAKGGGPLAALVRERQDLAARREGEDKRLLAAVGAGNADLAAQARDSLARIDADLTALDKRLADEFPDYAALAAPKPLSLTGAQALLAPDEALVVFLDIPQFGRLPEETLIWLVARDAARWTSISLGTTALQERGEKLRCGLDASAWTDATSWPEESETQKAEKRAQQARRARCTTLLGLDAKDNEPPPFDLAAAHDLYTALFGPIEDAIKGKRLLIAASGPLTRLPLGVLVTELPKVKIAHTGADFDGVAWLAKVHALTVLPSVASLAALRKLAKDSPPAPKPFLGVGNPLLDGDPASPDEVIRAKAARATQHCPKAAPREAEGLVLASARSPARGAFFRDGLADTREIRRQLPLPETAGELCAIARALGAPEDAVMLGENATETKVKMLSESGALAKARVVEFATHGLLASESEAYLKAGAEPGLILTPPGVASEADDGLLTASEVARLRLNADWVVLSACNTAGGEKADTEALSGLARAFFYAGAKSLLVSHWPVDSDAAVKLTTGAFAALEADPKIGRAEALRRSLAAMMADKTRPATWTPAAHPAVWAPFVLVGEGEARQ